MGAAGSQEPAATPSVPEQARALIKRLGTRADSDPNASVGHLHSYGIGVVPLLVAELKVEEPLPKDLAEFRSAEDRLGYAMEWMSHARVFIAPRDVQLEVVTAWQGWCAAHCSSFDIRPFESYGDWYF